MNIVVVVAVGDDGTIHLVQEISTATNIAIIIQPHPGGMIFIIIDDNTLLDKNTPTKKNTNQFASFVERLSLYITFSSSAVVL